MPRLSGRSSSAGRSTAFVMHRSTVRIRPAAPPMSCSVGSQHRRTKNLASSGLPTYRGEYRPHGFKFLWVGRFLNGERFFLNGELSSNQCMHSHMSHKLKIYCDTSTLAPNIRDEKSLPELDALKELRLLAQQGTCTLLRSHIVLGELERTKDVGLRAQLKADYDLLEHVLQDEKLIGFNTVYDRYGGFTSSPLMLDVQDSEVCEKIYQEMIFNACDVFMTRDYGTIIGPMRQWLEATYPPLKIRLPTELTGEIRAARSLKHDSAP